MLQKSEQSEKRTKNSNVRKFGKWRNVSKISIFLSSLEMWQLWIHISAPHQSAGTESLLHFLLYPPQPVAFRQGYVLPGSPISPSGWFYSSILPACTWGGGIWVCQPWYRPTYTDGTNISISYLRVITVTLNQSSFSPNCIWEIQPASSWEDIWSIGKSEFDILT